MPWSVSISQLLEVLCAQPINLSEAALTQVSSTIQTDTRRIKPGEVFLALRGENFDGHDFVSHAIAQGAIAAIVDSDYENADVAVLQVRDTLQAYQQLGRWWRDRLNIPVIGVTGSVGKTTTKELIAAVLATEGRVHKTFGNFNNEIGVPKTLLELDTEHDYAVVEMAMRGEGQIRELTQIARPNIGVITNVGTAHIELLGSEEAIARAKCELLAEMPEDSVAILNHDNPLLMATAQQVWSGEVVTYGLSGGDIQGVLTDNQTIKVGEMRLPLPLPGRHNASNFLAALAVAQVLGIDWSTLQNGVKVNMPTGRSQRFTLPHDIILLDETYNAAPEAMTAALQLLADTPGKRKIAVLGAMKELGERSLQLHQRVGETVQRLQLDGLLVLVDGKDAQAIAQSAEGIPSECFTTHADLVARLKTFVQAGDRILFKAAHSVGLDRVVNQFRAEFL
ncbi:UDP-N-acetylmuramoyl-tripeptide--D-alanyl-D-alanine ligase [Nodularia spumigena CS-584]|jgi:UDP-N-acetylmuramoyl-tripeptide--D-alanyl-D-alanine ligase|uniref:UDP-N-acetylmuramoyl-tripeptide--D-alanyl-D-alanine ligase n=2 Tax=Nodularia spumigena TaxID=70799 RepID=A0A2S0Q5D7_NODSP|nr:UDP-N-acetylmuramoyl-tripeptide--D-alanyl-D-alanine ligase [Nodularia spumigena]AHJ26915.1 UDP-N-acetylmuramoylalanyl-D-glutamyl-2,6- diaminopimelate--D-alanyl-D-alanine ligase [Nodularia spumigena CCY9414]AVZ29591.1 UDP-N-acetylmuramoyl-tripeptide--D-alanyl-D-alanine ligase [Nodularia spumigena UHCC 0039]EAW44466.1 UDP-N-acetylmuramoylalanyl-D-glutamyl-2,6-diaminopimelate--D-alanyl-D-alanine ligase [Nodularia spumigena CCY9414]MDB9380782.1 UDP-N-acetylmuramoyl-tripeptide--D-alanyl-D-alanine